jgi:hypothetical protein
MFPFEPVMGCPQMAGWVCINFWRSFRHQYWLGAKPVHGTEHEVRLCDRTDTENAIRFIAPAKEQLALVAEARFHGTPLVKVCEVKLLVPPDFVARRTVIRWRGIVCQRLWIGCRLMVILHDWWGWFFGISFGSAPEQHTEQIVKWVHDWFGLSFY